MKREEARATAWLDSAAVTVAGLGSRDRGWDARAMLSENLQRRIPVRRSRPRPVPGDSHELAQERRQLVRRDEGAQPAQPGERPALSEVAVGRALSLQRWRDERALASGHSSVALGKAWASLLEPGGEAFLPCAAVERTGTGREVLQPIQPRRSTRRSCRRKTGRTERRDIRESARDRWDGEEHGESWGRRGSLALEERLTWAAPGGRQTP